ncbi:hypothetical protein WJX72_008200 [[Myrmecia] bisecta]|uniref:Uncharacterized protein n=1 Tax=[Myrmecia] bisecta TaxID=41462 RepID=A0AAW1PHR4_9CHLO
MAGDLAALDKWAAPHVVLHKDDLTIEHDVEGLQKVRTFYTALFEKYSYKHVPAVYGANAVADTSYCFAQDQQVLPKSATMAAERGNEEQPEPTNHAAMFRYQFNDDMKLTGIWLLRQLTREEMQQKVRNPAAARLEDININAYKASAPAPPADLAQRMVENADLYRDIWAKALSACDSQAQWDADLCLRPSAHIIDLVFGTKYVGLPRFKQQLHGMHKEWQVNEQSHEVALVPDDMKAFIFYTQKGVELDTSVPSFFFFFFFFFFRRQSVSFFFFFFFYFRSLICVCVSLVVFEGTAALEPSLQPCDLPRTAPLTSTSQSVEQQLQRIWESMAQCVHVRRSPVLTQEQLWQLPLEDGLFRCNMQAPERMSNGQLRLERIKQFLEDLPGGSAKTALVQDIAELLVVFSSVLGCNLVEVCLVYDINHPRTPIFHTDTVDAVMTCTYMGRGTLWVDEDNVQRVEGVNRPIAIHDSSRIREAETTALLLLKGRGFPGQPVGHGGCVHSSPYASHTEPRLVLILTTPTRQEIKARERSQQLPQEQQQQQRRRASSTNSGSSEQYGMQHNARHDLRRENHQQQGE